MCMNKKKVLLLLAGPSGSGKSYIAELLQKKGLKKLISYTTRPPRGPLDDHIFITDEEFRVLEDLAAYTEFNGCRYGATKRQVRESDIYVVDIPGIENLRRNQPDDVQLLAAYITASEAERKRRMTARGDAPSQVNERIRHDRVAFCNAYDRLEDLLGPHNVVFCSNECPDDAGRITAFLLDCLHNLEAAQ